MQKSYDSPLNFENGRKSYGPKILINTPKYIMIPSNVNISDKDVSKNNILHSTQLLIPFRIP